MKTTSLFLCLSLIYTSLATEVLAKKAVLAAEKEDQFDIFDRPANAPLLRTRVSSKLSEQANHLMMDLQLEEAFKELKKLESENSSENELRILVLQSLISRKIQKASLEIQETFSNIDGDIAQNNMLLAYASNRQERLLRMTDVATFLTIGTFGVLESAVGRETGLSDIFGLVGSSASIALPLAALKPMHFNNPRYNQPRTNMLAPIFDVEYKGDGYEPIVWNYLNSVPPQSVSMRTRREMLIKSWQSYRSFDEIKGETNRKIFRQIIEAPSKENRLTVDSLKTRAQLLLDVRSLVQALYRDLAELDNYLD